MTLKALEPGDPEPCGFYEVVLKTRNIIDSITETFIPALRI
jgi:hypothetical protein